MGLIVKRFSVFLVAAICSLLQVSAQQLNLANQEKSLAALYKNLLRSFDAGFDSTSYYSQRFANDMKKTVLGNPGSLTYPFKKLIDNSYCYIASSQDGQFRIYSWDSWTGGTMHNFEQFFQYSWQGRVLTQFPKSQEGDPGNFCSKIFTVMINSKPYYLAVCNAIYSTKDGSQSLTAYGIDSSGKVENVKLFRSNSGDKSTIDLEFDLLSIQSRPERPLALITFDEKLIQLSLPLVNVKGEVLSENVKYALKNGKFEILDK